MPVLSTLRKCPAEGLEKSSKLVKKLNLEEPSKSMKKLKLEEPSESMKKLKLEEEWKPVCGHCKDQLEHSKRFYVHAKLFWTDKGGKRCMVKGTFLVDCGCSGP